MRGAVANFGAVVVSHARGVSVSPRIVRRRRREPARRLHGAAGPTSTRTRKASTAPSPSSAPFRPLPARTTLVFDTPEPPRRRAVHLPLLDDDTTPPAVRLLTRTVRAGGRLRLTVRDRGSGVDPHSFFATVDGRLHTVIYDPRRGLAEIVSGASPAGRHKLVFRAADYQETKNNEDGAPHAAEHAAGQHDVRRPRV